MASQFSSPVNVSRGDRPRIRQLLEHHRLLHLWEVVLANLTAFPEIEFVTISSTGASFYVRGATLVLVGTPSKIPGGGQ